MLNNLLKLNNSLIETIIIDSVFRLSFLQMFLHGKNDFAERSKILLDTDLKIILLDHQNNFVGTLKIMNNAAKFDTLAISLSDIHNYFDRSINLPF